MSASVMFIQSPFCLVSILQKFVCNHQRLLQSHKSQNVHTGLEFGFLLIVFNREYMECRDSEEIPGLVDSILYSFTFVNFADVIADQLTNFVDLGKKN